MEEKIKIFNKLLKRVRPSCLGVISNKHNIRHRDLSQHDRKIHVFADIESFLDIDIHFFGTTISKIYNLTEAKLDDAIVKMEKIAKKDGDVTTMNNLKVGKFYKLLEVVKLFKEAIISADSVIYVEKRGYNYSNKTSIIVVSGSVELYRNSNSYGGGWNTYPPTSKTTRISFDPYSITSNKIKMYTKVPPKIQQKLDKFLQDS